MNASTLIQVTAPLLTLIVFLPLLGAIVLMFLPREEKGLLRNGALLFSGAAFLASLSLLGVSGDYFNLNATPVSAAYPTMQLVESYPWVPSIGASYLVGVDGVSVWFVLLAALLGPLAVLSSFRVVGERVKAFMVALLVLQTGMLGALVALDGLLFAFFWELTLVPAFFLIGIWGQERRSYASLKFVVFSLVGSAFMWAALLYIYAKTGSGGGGYAFSIDALTAVTLSGTEQTWLFVAFALSFAIKMALFPFHTWLPDAHSEPPAAVSMLLAGVMLKMGVYGLYRFAMPLVPEGMATLAPLMALLAVLGLLFAGQVAMVQRDAKRVVAYISVAHLAFCALGLATLTHQGIEGALVMVLAHGLAVAGLFVCVGIVYEHLGTQDINALGALRAKAPGLAFMFAALALAAAGVPGLAGFAGEFLVILGTSQSKVLHLGDLVGPQLWFEGPTGTLALEGFALIFTILAALATVFGAVYALWMFQRVMLRAPDGKNDQSAQIGLVPREVVILVPLVLLSAMLGLYPEAVLGKSHRTVEHLLTVHMQPGISAKVTPEQVEALNRASAVQWDKPGPSGRVLTPKVPPKTSATKIETKKPEPSPDDGGVKTAPPPSPKKTISDKARQIPKQPLRLSPEALERLKKRVEEKKKKDAP